MARILLHGLPRVTSAGASGLPHLPDGMPGMISVGACQAGHIETVVVKADDFLYLQEAKAGKFLSCQCSGRQAAVTNSALFSDPP